MTYRCANAACPMAAVDLPEPAATALGLRCSVCGGGLLQRSGAGSCAADYDATLGVESLPSILAIPLREYRDEANPILRLWQACDFVELALRLLVMAGVADLCRGGELSPSVLGEIRSRIARPMLGHWRGMAEAVAQALDPVRTVLPELRHYILDTLAPFLDGRATPATPETSFSELRNRLAHGGGMPKAYAARLVAIWSDPFRKVVENAAWLSETALLVRGASGTFGLLRGPSVKPGPAEGIDPKALAAASASPGSVVLARGPHALTLWPLALYGEPLRPGEEKAQGLGEAPQIYTRTGEVRLQYTPLGADWVAQSEGTDEALAAFRRLFRLEDHSDAANVSKPTVRGFEGEIREDAADMVGRGAEVAQLASLVRERTGGVAWVHGEAGSGKSYVLAAAVADLFDRPPDGALLLPYRFKVGDDRCGREPFLRFAIERLGGWDGLLPETEDANKPDLENIKPLDRLRQLVGRVDEGRRAVFVLDGLDEVAGSDARFAEEVPLAVRLPRVLWLCASRPERGLPEAFRRAKAEEPWPEGLPRMTENAVRAMLLERIQTSSRLRKRLLEGDREEGAKGEEKVVNSFVNRVTKNAAGLPIYVRYVVNDILGGKLSPEPEADLPPSLAEYHERLLERCEIGDLRQVLTPLVATLAAAHESLTPEALADLLARRTIVREGESGLALVRQSLSAVESTVRRASTPEGDGGYTLFHASFRDHVLSSPRTVEAVATARNAIGDATIDWKWMSTTAAGRYLFRQGVRHLLDGDRAAEAANLLTTFAYLMARTAKFPASEVSRLVGEYGSVSAKLDGSAQKALTAWDAFFRERAHILRRGDRAWSVQRILLQLAVEHADESRITAAAENWLEAGACDWVWLQARNRPEKASQACSSVALEGHSGAVNGALALSDHRILSWSEDGTLRLWDQELGTQLAVLEGHTREVSGAFMLADGRIVSWAKKDGEMRIWDGKSGAPLGVLDAHSRRTSSATLPYIDGVQVSDDGRILSWGHDGTLRVSELSSGQLLTVMKEDTNWVMSAQWLPEGRILSMAFGSILRLWDGAMGKRLALLEGHTLDLEGVQVIPGRRILSWSSDGTVRLWDLASGRPLAVLMGHTMAVNGALTVEYDRILSWSYDTTLRLWDGTSGATLAVLKGHSDLVVGAQVLPDGRILSWSRDCTLRIWDGVTGAALSVLKGHTAGVNGAGVLADGRIFSWSWDRTLRLWDSASGTLIGLLEGHFDGVTGAALLPENRILSWSCDGTLRVWADLEHVPGRTGRHAGRVNGLKALPDHRVLSWSNDGNLAIWEEATGVMIKVLEGHTEQVLNAWVLPQGNILSRAGDTTMRLWDGMSGEPLALLKRPSERMLGAEVLPDGRILSMSWKTLHLWDGRKGGLLAVLDGHTNRIEDVRVLLDGRILSWSKDTTLRLWDGATGAPLAVFQGGLGFAGAEVLAGGKVLSWSDNGTLRVWDVETGEQLAACGANVMGDLDPVDYILKKLLNEFDAIEGAFALPNGRILFWSGSGILYLWDGSTGSRVETVVMKARLVGALKKSPNGEFIGSFDDRRIRMFDKNTGAIRAVLNGASGGKASVLWVFANGRVVECAVDSKRLLVWQLAGDSDIAPAKELLPESVWESDSPVAASCLSGGCHLWVGTASGRVLAVEVRHRG